MDSRIKIEKTSEFEEWYNSLRTKEKMQVDKRLAKIAFHSHFGDVKGLGDGLAELRWKNGWRIYFCRPSQSTVLVLLGGDKNGQEKDIKKARLLLR